MWKSLGNQGEKSNNADCTSKSIGYKPAPKLNNLRAVYLEGGFSVSEQPDGAMGAYGGKRE
jgi:hypothetical protein